MAQFHRGCLSSPFPTTNTHNAQTENNNHDATGVATRHSGCAWLYYE
nr:MAG TPA: hypothetical protein [Caudoviricetes sp.]